LKDEGSISYESQRHAFVCTQFVISGTMLSAAFVLLGTANYVADETEKTIGSWGTGAANFVAAPGHRPRNGRDRVLEVAAALARD
jgi:ABC-type transporter lipoprotein component MlaA